MKITRTAEYDPTTRKLTFMRHVELEDVHLDMLRRIESKGGQIRERKVSDSESDLLWAMTDANVLRTDRNDWHTTFYLNNASRKILAAHGKSKGGDA